MLQGMYRQASKTRIVKAKSGEWRKVIVQTCKQLVLSAALSRKWKTMPLLLGYCGISIPSVNTVNIAIRQLQLTSYTTRRSAHFRMSVLQLLTGLLDQHGDTMQQAALLAYLKQGEEAQPALEVGFLDKLAFNYSFKAS